MNSRFIIRNIINGLKKWLTFGSFGAYLFVFLALGLFWAKWCDPFSRSFVTLRTPGNVSFPSVVIVPKSVLRLPVIIYVHGASDNLIADGNDLRILAELGMATVSIGYNQTNEIAFESEFETLIQYIAGRKWADTNAVAWVGFGLGGNLLQQFVCRHPDFQPKLVAEIGSAGFFNGYNKSRFEPLHCSFLLVHGSRDAIYPLNNTQFLARDLASCGIPVALKTIPDAPNNLGEDRGLVFRCVGEYCRTHLVKDAWQNYHSIAQRKEDAPPFYIFWLLTALGMSFLGARVCRRKASEVPERQLDHYEASLLLVAICFGILVISEIAIHLIVPLFPINSTSLSIARYFLTPADRRSDFEFLAAQPIWHGQKLKALLDNAELANYNRQIVNWHFDDNIYDKYVLSPIISGDPNEEFDWRRYFWEEFYPQIRSEPLPSEAARCIVRSLRERVTIAAIPNPPREVPAIWLRQITDKNGFEIIYVAGLRSVGVPARLDKNQQAEIFVNNQWQPAPRPVVESFCNN